MKVQERRLPSVSRTAEGVLTRLGLSGTTPDLQAALGLWPDVSVSLDELDSDGYLIDLGVQGRQLLVTSRGPRTRRRFTVAHEIGHLCLAEHGIEWNATTDSEVERWCDRFASELLLPRASLIEDLKSTSASNLCDVLLRLPHRYSVSRQVAWTRVAVLFGGTILVALSEASGVRVEHRYVPRRGEPGEALGAFGRHQATLVESERAHAVDVPTGLTLAAKRIHISASAKKHLVGIFPAAQWDELASFRASTSNLD